MQQAETITAINKTTTPEHCRTFPNGNTKLIAIMQYPRRDASKGCNWRERDHEIRHTAITSRIKS